MNSFVRKNGYLELHISNCKHSGIVKIDIEDEIKVKQHSWYIKDKAKESHLQYVCAKINNKTVKLHRFLLNLVNFDKTNLVDHINRDTFDNRKSNLRIVSYSLNNHNSSIRKTNKSGIKGISIKTRYDGRSDQVQAKIRIDGRIYLKSFSINKHGLDEAMKLGKLFLDEIKISNNLLT